MVNSFRTKLNKSKDVNIPKDLNDINNKAVIEGIELSLKNKL